MAKKKVRKKKAMPQGDKTSSVSVRMDPVIRWQLELLSRIERRSMSAVIEDAIEGRAKSTPADGHGEFSETIAQLGAASYSPNDLERLIRLAMREPSLLTYEEVRQWDVIKKTPELWKDEAFDDRRFNDSDFLWHRLNRHLSTLQILVQEAASERVTEAIPEDEIKALGIKLSDWRLPF